MSDESRTARGFSNRARDVLFVVAWRLDEMLHSLGLDSRRLCRLVGRMEPGYYDRHMDWDNPLYVNPATHPELYLQHAASLCAHGYREGCPKGCA